MEGATVKQSIRLLHQVGLGFVFLYAGGYKIFVSGIAQFSVDVGNYQLLSQPMIETVSYFLPWLEVVVGLCLMLNFWRHGALVCASGMTLVFIGAIGWAWSQGLDITGGCFGKSDSKVNYPVKMLLLLWQLAAGMIAVTGKVPTWENVAPRNELSKGENL